MQRHNPVTKQCSLHILRYNRFTSDSLKFILLISSYTRFKHFCTPYRLTSNIV
jgi:hypothetical protein